MHFNAIGVDFTLAVGTDTISGFADSELPASIGIELVDDRVPGEVESFVLELANPQLTDLNQVPREVLVANMLTVNIVDNDGEGYTVLLVVLNKFILLYDCFQPLELDSVSQNMKLMSQI